MKFKPFFAIILLAGLFLSCKRDKNCDSTTASVTFENTSPDEIFVEISRLGELNTGFRQSEKSYFIDTYSKRTEELAAGDRLIRWSSCVTLAACTEISLKEVNYKACKEYNEKPGR